MRIPIVGALVLAGWLGAGGYWHVCHIRCMCGDTPVPQTQTLTEPSQPEEPQPASLKVPWKITDGQNVILTFPGSTRLLQDSPEVEIDMDAENFADSMFVALRDYEQGNIDVIGWYSESELAPDGFTTLGLARAYRIKQRLMAAGIPEDKIRTQSKAIPINFNAEGMAGGGIEMEIHERMDVVSPEDALADATEVDTEEIPAGSQDAVTRKTLYCEFGISAFKPDPALEVYAPKALAYMENNPDVTMYITGHADSKGSQKTNYQYGRARAGKARRFFRDQGIPLRRIKIDSKGEKEPVATNETDEGRALNRRVEITIE